jgi:hypothetical protein
VCSSDLTGPVRTTSMTAPDYKTCVDNEKVVLNNIKSKTPGVDHVDGVCLEFPDAGVTNNNKKIGPH